MPWSNFVSMCGLAMFLAAGPLSGAEEKPAVSDKSAAPGPVETASRPPPPGAPVHKHPETLLDFALAGGWMMVPLCAGSVILVGFFLERLVVLRRGKIAPRPLARAIHDLVQKKPLDRSRALSVVAAHPSVAASILRSAIERLDSPPERIEKSVQNIAERELYHLRSNLWIFAVLSTISPLLGLLGTVAGLVQAFREVAITGLGAGSTLAPGIYEALVTTVAGLAIAIPSIAAYYWLQAKVDRYVHEIDVMVVDLVEAGELSTAAA
jgi:biopolymer transport protein ExbB